MSLTPADALRLSAAFAAGMALCLTIVLIVAPRSLSARCERAYPRDGLAIERCVYALEHGQRP